MKRKFPYKDKEKEKEFQEFKSAYHVKIKRERLEKARHAQNK
tara:strand:- start:281 stop:406 length:126 start_codon:yes stop_codon:yes gene_type:complete